MDKHESVVLLFFLLSGLVFKLRIHFLFHHRGVVGLLLVRVKSYMAFKGLFSCSFALIVLTLLGNLARRVIVFDLLNAIPVFGLAPIRVRVGDHSDGL
jgi:hypothetical protein